jgi:hypothetical protein
MLVNFQHPLISDLVSLVHVKGSWTRCDMALTWLFLLNVCLDYSQDFECSGLGLFIFGLLLTIPGPLQGHILC